MGECYKKSKCMFNGIVYTKEKCKKDWPEVNRGGTGKDTHKKLYLTWVWSVVRIFQTETREKSVQALR